MNATISAPTLAGKYLARIEQFLAALEFDNSQWTVSWAHMRLWGWGTPGPFIGFSKVYDEKDLDDLL